ncbi:AAA domain-containing protein [Sulfitobacter guttiformis]|uniref:AAA domain-containing protein n=1 Tax=Sulfitobacter guttiformis TaxID=74349 RepID=UPI0018DB8897|nr:AAA domain-containing protein [Sulfitobacter guttiformis]
MLSLDQALTSSPASIDLEGETLVAAPFSQQTAEYADPAFDEDLATDTTRLDPQALLRYWRSALRSDPRGATTQTPDRHGDNWQLIAGKGPFVPADGQKTVMKIDSEALAPNFRAALLRREANENTLAIGWPIAIGRKSGVPAIWPVGLITADWRRVDGYLEIEVSTNDVLINPEWLRGTARNTGWKANELADVFAKTDGVGLETDEFLARLRDSSAKQIRGKITCDWLAGELNTANEGIFDAAALFLPNDSSFTAGAIRDLDEIAAWPEARLSSTALAPLLGINPAASEGSTPTINVGPLNAEQIGAVQQACQKPLTVVTGPPGTGKSQAIVSMAASVLAAGGSVVVASKNHQALDAVQERLDSIAAEAPFIVRTLDPQKDVDRSFSTVLNELVSGGQGQRRAVDQLLVDKLQQMSQDRDLGMASSALRAQFECELAELLDRMDARKKYTTSHTEKPPSVEKPLNTWSRFLDWLFSLFRKTQTDETPKNVKVWSIAEIEHEIFRLRFERDEIETDTDLVELTNEIAELANRLLPLILSNRTSISAESWELLDNAKSEMDFSGSKTRVPPDASNEIVELRPLWLVSVLGAPKRLPLIDGLFDLVIFDEASQCDIASALPLFARARRAVVVGDNRQLSFIPGLSQAQDRNLMQAQNLPAASMSRYAQSRNSLFDFAQRAQGAERIMLRQQYRSFGTIVEYISGEFYGGALKTAYNPESIKPPKGQKPGLAWDHVAAPLAQSGNNVNKAEVAAIVKHLENLLLKDGYEGTVGVTSPFRGQVHAIEQAVRAKVPDHKLEAAEFRVATIDGFQGQERDVILFSPTLGPSSPMSAVGFLQKDFRRLNVAISRARAVAHVFGDLEYARSGKVRSLAALASAATEPRKRVGEGVFDSDWERRVFYALQKRGLTPQPQYEIVGRRLDFALFGANGVKLDLEVDGRFFHENTDGQRKQSDHWRDHQLKSLGWKVRRFWVDELAKDMEACLDIVERDLA